MILRGRIKGRIAIRNTKCIDAIAMGSFVTADIACSLCHHEVRGQMFEGSLPRNRKPFIRRALDLPFIDKVIQACGLKGSTEASWQSAVRRHTRARIFVVVVVVVVVVTYLVLSCCLSCCFFLLGLLQ